MNIRILFNFSNVLLLNYGNQVIFAFQKQIIYKNMPHISIRGTEMPESPIRKLAHWLKLQKEEESKCTI